MARYIFLWEAAALGGRIKARTALDGLSCLRSIKPGTLCLKSLQGCELPSKPCDPASFYRVSNVCQTSMGTPSGMQGRHQLPSATLLGRLSSKMHDPALEKGSVMGDLQQTQAMRTRDGGMCASGLSPACFCHRWSLWTGSEGGGFQFTLTLLL